MQAQVVDQGVEQISKIARMIEPLLFAASSHGATAAENRKAEVVGAVSTPFVKALQNLSAQATTASILSLKPTPNV